MRKKTVSFLASGRGSNFKVVAEHVLGGDIHAKLGILISNKKDAKALDLAVDFGMKTFFVDPADYKSREEYDRELIRLLKDYKTDLVVAAGYMKILTPVFVSAFRHRIINIHPALLPSFPGVHAQEQAFDYGVKISGCTSHFIDEGTDTGPIIMQAPVPVMEHDTIEKLSARILKEEHRVLPESVKLFCDEKLEVKGRRVLIKQ
ncbi:MAG TPA: phosphoribosylglycinamide formyltransferase [Spirochaetota bacterium]|nr:phosphoribosylglycinamide formyltransferase [Spirochaetota bacterium]HPJ38661.1 phosphoribosylglycinamide formyltransferase [Spirochaetota bacterium]HPQ54780.1 phosphoribosylglycinamide formyltransferase [Spirochaetota bacterium]